ncbi:MAG: methyltransferase [Nanoarchaeota archaeon]|nr:methyltransferase [Nanoarchaeota archaeon]MBU1103462.1 methyltransferase [Nanoarchaeota archaeon]
MIYTPREDSHLLEKEVRKYAKGKKVLDIGSGNGIQAQAALVSGAREILAVDINPEAVKHCKKNGLDAIQSDLFENVEGKFDLIIFNPPYLPGDEREDAESAVATSGGEKGDEIIVRFLENVGEHLEKDGIILIVVSSLTPLDGIDKFVKEKRVVASAKVFMEELEVWEVRQSS